MTLRRLLPALFVLLAACGEPASKGGERLTVRVCGDGALQGTEECDDGNDVTEVCAYGAASCMVCDATCHFAPGATSACGDGRIDATRETCDDGNTVTEACPYGERCSVCDATCALVQVRRMCGDGVVDADGGEGCDDGAANDDERPGACRTDCTPARCGDGVIDPGESCETPGVGDCRTDCTTVTCGDGRLDPGEACDPGLDATCRADCTVPSCGDARLDPGEACDDGLLAPVALAGGESGGCALVEGGRVQCWSTNPALDAVPAGLPPARRIAVGSSWACILDGEGRPQCWGEDPLGAAGNLLAPPDDRFVEISAGFAHACGQREDGSLECWGRIESPFWADQGGLHQLGSGHGFSCVLVQGGAVGCWGSRTFGEALAGTFVELQVARTYVCGIRTDGTLACGGAAPAGAPEEPLHGLALARRTACGLAEDGAAVCWGAQPGRHAGPFERLVAVGDAICGMSDGGLACWGGSVPFAANGALPGACRADCTAPTCGDGVVDPGEDCDDGDVIDSGNGCSAACTRVGTCGDGVVQAAFEACDDGNASTERCGYGESCTACDATCNWSAGIEAHCGDGIVDAPDETCDDGDGATGYFGLSLGANSGCGLRADGSVTCWGDAAIETGPEGPFVQVEAGVGFACAREPGGAVRCWGDGAVSPEGVFVALDAGPSFACGIRDDGHLACWGDAAPAVPATGRYAVVSVGEKLVCALDDAGQMSCWGPESELAYPRPEGAFAGVAVGGTLHCAIRLDGTLACWGPEMDLAVPTFPVVAATAGESHVCVIDRTDAVSCFGRPAPIPDAGRFASITSGGRWACGLRLDGAARCWGRDALPLPANGRGRACDACRVPTCGDGVVDAFEACDDGNTEIEACPYDVRSCQVCGPNCVHVAGRTSWCGDLVVDTANGETCDQGTSFAFDVQFGEGFSCAITSPGLRCWGRNAVGQATPPAGLFGPLAVGARHACAMGAGGAIHCWGADDAGQLHAPQIAGLRTGAFLAAGRDFTCVADPAGGIACWGDVPFTPPPAGNWTQLVAGERHLCALGAQGAVACWGENEFGQSTPPAGLQAEWLVVGRNHTCAGAGPDDDFGRYEVLCWGDGSSGQFPPSPAYAYDAVAGDGATCLHTVGSTWRCSGSGSAAQFTALQPHVTLSRWEPGVGCAFDVFSPLSCWGTPQVPDSIPQVNSDTRADACRSNCQPARCGDGVVDTGEACDDGNTAAGDGCDAACGEE